MRLKKLFKPRAGTILVKRLPVSTEHKTESGIIIPGNNKDSLSELVPAEVVRVGDDFLNYKMECQEGDIILVTKSAVTKGNMFVIVEGHKYYQLFEKDYFWGKIEE